MLVDRPADDTCPLALDTKCDEPKPTCLDTSKANCTEACSAGTDCTDCGTCNATIAPSGFVNATIAGRVRQAAFGAQLRVLGQLDADLVLAMPPGACSPLMNNVNGLVVLVLTSAPLLDQNSFCSHAQMALHVQQAGGVAMLLYAHGYAMEWDDGDASAAVTIPAVLLSPSDKAWAYLLRPLFADLETYVSCKRSVDAAMSGFALASGNADACLDDLDNPSHAALVTALGCLETHAGGVTRNVRLYHNASQVEAKYSIEHMAYFSSRGPTADGRQKPDLSCPGHSIMSSRSDGNPYSFQCSGSVPGGADAATTNTTYFYQAIKSMSGTSMATPLCAGAAALVREYYAAGHYAGDGVAPPAGVPHAAEGAGFAPSAALLKATMIHGGQLMNGSASDCEHGCAADGSDETPFWNMSVPTAMLQQGYGRLRLDTVLRQPTSDFELAVFDGLHNASSEHCLASCAWSSDGQCDDGGENSAYSLCAFGSDCTDCGARSDMCMTTCRFSSDGDCDDGGAGSEYDNCELGTDCADCGGRHLPALSTVSVFDTGDSWARCVHVSGGVGGILKVTLAWTDYPSSMLAARTLVNDLALVVTDASGSPLGTLNGHPAPYDDRLNNVEQAIVETGSGGAVAAANITVRVLGVRMAHGPQEFALVLTGPLGLIVAEGPCSARCPSDCGGNGACQPDGTCSCAAGFDGPGCAAPAPSPPPSAPPLPPPPPPVPPEQFYGRDRVSLIAVLDGGFDASHCTAAFANLTGVAARFISLDFSGSGGVLTASLTAMTGEGAAIATALRALTAAQLQALLDVTFANGAAPLVTVSAVFLPTACCCAADGVSGGVDTGRPGCSAHGMSSVGDYCYAVAPAGCELTAPSSAFPGAGFLPCDYLTACVATASDISPPPHPPNAAPLPPPRPPSPPTLPPHPPDSAPRSPLSQGAMRPSEAGDAGLPWGIAVLCFFLGTLTGAAAVACSQSGRKLPAQVSHFLPKGSAIMSMLPKRLEEEKGASGSEMTPKPPDSSAATAVEVERL